MSDKPRPTGWTSLFALFSVALVPTWIFLALMLSGGRFVTPMLELWAFCLSASFTVGAAMMLYRRREQRTFRLAVLVMFLNINSIIVQGYSLVFELAFMR
jgi:hypothetical protein